MATEILRPQDCLIQRIKVSPCRRRNFHYHGHGSNGNGNANYYSSNSSTSSSSSSSSSNPRFNNRKPVAGGQRSSDHQRKRHQPEPSISKRSTSADDLRISSRNHQHQNQHHHQNHSLVMDKVTILRRGESLASRTIAGGETSSAAAAVVVARATGRIGPCPEVVPRQIRITDGKPRPPPPVGSRKCDVYAGSAFAVSPAPSALPLPSFSKKQVSVDDSATRDLRRLLRLDL